jgi:hypothetical protein
MKIDKVCEALKVDRYTVYQLLNSGKLHGYTVSKWEISRVSLLGYLKRNPTTTPAPLGKDELAVWLKAIR